MLLFVVSYVAGVLTIISPCILPVLPFVFARASQSFLRGGLPLLIGMALTFVGVASLATVGGWAVQANEYGRYAAIVLLAVFALALLFPQLSDWLTRPLVAAGARLSNSAQGDPQTNVSIVSSLLLGVATGLLWAPCAGPILGLILTGAALRGASLQTSLLLLAYAAGAATSLAGAMLIGGRLFAAMKQSLGVSEWIRRGLGVAVLAAVVAIALGLDTGFLAQLSTASTTKVEQVLINQAGLQRGGAQVPSGTTTTASDGTLPVEGDFPPLYGAVQWLNSKPLSPESLRGKVVLIDFWTYSCINCLRAIPYVRAWAEKYKDQGLVVIGVHTPEFAFEYNVDNVRKAISMLKIDYPVAIDNDYAIWRAFNNEYWPAHYFIDAQGHIRFHHFGEGDYDHSEKVIQQLLAEAGQKNVSQTLVSVAAMGAEAAPSADKAKSQETYIGYDRAENFASPGGAVQDKPQNYTAPQLQLNQWALTGDWTIGSEQGTVNAPGGRIDYRFHARDLHLVLGPSSAGSPVRFRVLIDGKPPGADHGMDVDDQGYGTITDQRLYQLVRQESGITDRSFEIEFLDAGAQAFAFTFG